MASFIQTALRGAQFFFILLTLALIGNVIAEQQYGKSSVNYAMFVAVFDMLVIFWGLAASFKEELSFGIFLAIADGLALLFTLVAGIALAAVLRVHSCGNQGYLHSNDVIRASPNHLTKACHELQASCAFFWFAFAAFAASMALGLMNGGGSTSFRGGRNGIRKGPVMTQV